VTAYYISDTILGTGDITVNKTQFLQAWFYSLVEREDSKHCIWAEMCARMTLSPVYVEKKDWEF
jgi:hypothetical protein